MPIAARIRMIAKNCGMRISELCGLRADDLNWSDQIIRVRGKGKKERLVPIGAPALQVSVAMS